MARVKVLPSEGIWAGRLAWLGLALSAGILGLCLGAHRGIQRFRPQHGPATGRGALLGTALGSHHVTAGLCPGNAHARRRPRSGQPAQPGGTASAGRA